MKVSPSAIAVLKNRQRKSETRISDLAMSMHTKGQFHPILVRKPDPLKESDEGLRPDSWVLVAGYRRLLAARELQWTEIEAKEITSASELELEEIELDENLQRENLPYQEEVFAKKRIYEVRQKLYKETFAETADHLNIGKGTFWEDVELAKAMEVIPELKDARNKSAAQNKLRAIKRRVELQDLVQKHREGSFDFGEASNHVRLGNCLEVMRGYESEAYHLVHTDPPYGIFLDEIKGGASAYHETAYHIYSDEHYEVMDLLEAVVKECYRILVPNAHMYFWFDIKMHSQIFRILTEAGFAVDPVPLIWVKNVSGQANSPNSRWASGYEACFFCRKGLRALLTPGQSNLLKFDVVHSAKKIHPTEKPVELIKKLIEASTVPGEVVVDPFGGSGSTGAAALELGRNYLLIEKDEAYFAQIIQRLNVLHEAGRKPVSTESAEELSEEEEADWDEAAKRRAK